MSFLGVFQLYERFIKDKYGYRIQVETFDYDHAGFELDKNGRISSTGETVPCEDSLASDLLVNHNEATYIRLLNDEKQVNLDYEKDPEVPKYKEQKKFVSELKSYFKYWFHTNGFTIPEVKVETHITKKDEFYDLFVKLVKSDTTTEEEVRQDLYNKERWKNPSQYLNLAKKRYDITTIELKRRPGFGFIDPKGTSLD